MDYRHNYRNDIRECKNCDRKYICDVKDFDFCRAECLFEYDKKKGKEKVIRPTKREFDHELSTHSSKSMSNDDIKKLLSGQTKKCAYCGGQFQTEESWKTFCTKECYELGKNDMETKKCDNCRKSFKTDQDWRRFCNKQCYEDYRCRKAY